MTDRPEKPDEISARLRRVGDALKEAGILPTKPDASKPLTADELMELESKAGVTGLSTEEVRRLLANNARLRRLVLDAARVLAPSASSADKLAREVYDAIKKGAKR